MNICFPGGTCYKVYLGFTPHPGLSSHQQQIPRNLHSSLVLGGGFAPRNAQSWHFCWYFSPSLPPLAPSSWTVWTEDTFQDVFCDGQSTVGFRTCHATHITFIQAHLESQAGDRYQPLAQWKKMGGRPHHAATKQCKDLRINLVIWKQPPLFQHLHIFTPLFAMGVLFLAKGTLICIAMQLSQTVCWHKESLHAEFSRFTSSKHTIPGELHGWMWMEGSGWLLGKWFMGNIWINMIISMGWWLWIIEGVPSEGKLEYRPTDRNIVKSSFPTGTSEIFRVFCFPMSLPRAQRLDVAVPLAFPDLKERATLGTAKCFSPGGWRGWSCEQHSNNHNNDLNFWIHSSCCFWQKTHEFKFKSIFHVQLYDIGRL